MALWWRAGTACPSSQCSAGLGADTGRGGIGVDPGKMSRLGAENVRISGDRLGSPVVFRQGSLLGRRVCRLLLRGRRLVLRLWRVLRWWRVLRHRERCLDQRLAVRAWPCDASHATGYSQLGVARWAKENDLIFNTQVGLFLAQPWLFVNPSEKLNSAARQLFRSLGCRFDREARDKLETKRNCRFFSGQAPHGLL